MKSRRKEFPPGPLTLLLWPSHFKILSFLILFFGFSVGLHAQVSAEKINVPGMVTDSAGAPMPSVTVTEKGKSNTTVTGIDGRFAISVNGEKSVLVFSSVGYSRATESAALVMETRAALYAGSIAKYGATTPSVSLPNAEVGIPATAANGYYQKALTAAQEIINGQAGDIQLYRVLPDLSDNFAAIFLDKSSVNKEALFIEDFKRNVSVTAAGGQATANFGVEKIVTDPADAKDIEYVALFINKTQFVSSAGDNKIGETGIGGADIAAPNSISLQVNIPGITPTQNYLFARMGLKIAGVEDRLYSSLQKIKF